MTWFLHCWVRGIYVGASQFETREEAQEASVLRSQRLARLGCSYLVNETPRHLPVTATLFGDVKPPFHSTQKVRCLRESREVSWSGQLNDNCRCTEGSFYEIDGCVWSWATGWLVSITGELHAADDFEAVP